MRICTCEQDLDSVNRSFRCEWVLTFSCHGLVKCQTLSRVLDNVCRGVCGEAMLDLSPDSLSDMYTGTWGRNESLSIHIFFFIRIILFIGDYCTPELCNKHERIKLNDHVVYKINFVNHGSMTYYVIIIFCIIFSETTSTHWRFIAKATQIVWFDFFVKVYTWFFWRPGQMWILSLHEF
jgi:hypothetical protein